MMNTDEYNKNYGHLSYKNRWYMNKFIRQILVYIAVVSSYNVFQSRYVLQC